MIWVSVRDTDDNLQQRLARKEQKMEITLNYWSPKSSNIERVYINDSHGESLGYFERRETSHARSGGGYYDRHRAAKGDTHTIESSDVSWHGQDGAASAVLDVVFADWSFGRGFDTWQEARAGGYNGQFVLWDGLCRNARGFRHACTKTSKRDQKTREANEARQLLSFEVTI